MLIYKYHIVAQSILLADIPWNPIYLVSAQNTAATRP